MGEHRPVHVAEAAGLRSNRVGDLPYAVAEIRDEGPTAAIQVSATLGIVQVATLPADDARIVPRQLPIEDVRGRVAVDGHDGGANVSGSDVSR